MFKRRNLRWATLAAAAGLVIGGNANASLVGFQTYNGSYGVSTDGWGGTDDNGVISASVPSGSTIVAAYLYTATYFASALVPTTVTLNGTPVSYTQNYQNTSVPLASNRADVTSIVQAAIGGGGGVFDFAINEGGQGGSINGNALVVVYSNPALPESTVGILDGFSAVGGDSTAINFADPLDPTNPDFFADMYLGISHSCCNQKSNVSVNGDLLTSNAGDFDDGEAQANGSLITVGSFDDPYAPINPDYTEDHEKYDLTPFLSLGDTMISVLTDNPSSDDDIFLAVFHVYGRAGINEPPPPVDPSDVPVPAAAWLFGAGLLGLRRALRKKTA